MHKAENSVLRSLHTASGQCGLASNGNWWLGNWWRFTPPAVPIASDCGEDS